MLWIKSFHIIFVASWFAGLFYLPRIFVNLAMVPKESVQERDRLLLMGKKLLRFTTLLMIPALALGVWLLLIEFVWTGAFSTTSMGWLHAKLGIVALTIYYHHLCAKHLRQFEKSSTSHTHIWYRWFNEIPVLFLTVSVILVVVKPF
jgi:putative membrane protein